MSQQVSYIKNLGTTKSVNTHAISNLSGIFKNVLIQPDDNFRQITRDILWLNITTYSQSELFMVI